MADHLTKVGSAKQSRVDQTRSDQTRSGQVRSDQIKSGKVTQVVTTGGAMSQQMGTFDSTVYIRTDHFVCVEQ